ncbi:MAG: hypothetical protein ABIA63_04780, partial [bacterium]
NQKPINFTLPSALKLGLAWSASERMLIATDFNYNFWKKNEPSMANSMSIGSGLEFRLKNGPKSNRLKKSIYRMGINYFKWNHDDIPEISLGLGMGIPVPNHLHLFNFSIEGGQRGALKENGLKENFCKINFGISASGKWGKRTAD